MRTPRKKSLIRRGLAKPTVYNARGSKLAGSGYVMAHPEGVGWTLSLKVAGLSVHTCHGHYWTKRDAEDALESALAAIREGRF